MNMWIFYQKELARTFLTITVSKFVEEKNYLLSHFHPHETRLPGQDSLSNTIDNAFNMFKAFEYMFGDNCSVYTMCTLIVVISTLKIFL